MLLLMSLKPNSRFRPTNWQVLAKSQNLPILQNLMIDILDDSYESDLTEEEHEQLILISEHAIAKPLSPAAKAVLDAAFTLADNLDREVTETEIIAAALRAAADQVVPWQPEPTEESVGPTINFGYAWALFSKANDVRQELLVIADELETQ
jgi:hypothetical protein